MSEEIVELWQCFECQRFFQTKAGKMIKFKPTEFALSDTFICNSCLNIRKVASDEEEKVGKEETNGAGND